MINGLNGEVRFSKKLVVGPSLTLSTLSTFPELDFWQLSTLGLITHYQRDMVDEVSRLYAATITFIGQKLYEIHLAFYERQDTENPQDSIFQPASFHKNWLREELGNWQHMYEWGFVTVGYIDSSFSSFACMVTYSSNFDHNRDISQAIGFSSNVNWQGGVSAKRWKHRKG
jgi:hypothetical protein